jgi:peptidyl-prolyl cis-trans isomerase C
LARRLAVGLVLLILPSLIALTPGCASDLPAGAVAQVGSNLISEDLLSAMVAAYEDAGKAPDKGDQGEQYELFKQKCTEYLVHLEVMNQKALQYGVSVTEEEVTARVDQIQGMFLGDEAKFNEAIAEQGLTLERMRESIRQSLWFEKMKAAVTAQVTVREEEVRGFYEEHKSEYVQDEARLVRHILISPFLDAAGNVISGTPTESDWEAAEIEAAKVRSEIMNGANFVTTVENYSDDESSSSNGGDLGTIVRGQTVPAFEQAVFALQKEEMSQPVRTPSGYSIIQVLDITPAQQLTYDSVKEQIRSALLQGKQADAWQKWLTETQLELGVVYRKGYAPPGAITGVPSTSTTLGLPTSLPGGAVDGSTTTVSQ